MNRRELGDAFVDSWLACVDPFDRRLHDTGERYNGKPVFMLPVYLNGDCSSVKLYRYEPVNSQYSVLAFLPEGATT